MNLEVVVSSLVSGFLLGGILALIALGLSISLGVMPHQGQAAMPIPEDLRILVANATLAITDEPAGGAPGGVATGPIVAQAEMRRI